jgi:hypothetical protein
MSHQERLFVCFMARQPPVGQGLLIHEVSRSHNDAPQSVGLLWTSDELASETSTRQHTTDKRPCPPVGFEPAISAGERPQTYALGRAATGTGRGLLLLEISLWGGGGEGRGGGGEEKIKLCLFYVGYF